jgi:hypothetical protein
VGAVLHVEGEKVRGRKPTPLRLPKGRTLLTMGPLDEWPAWRRWVANARRRREIPRGRSGPKRIQDAERLATRVSEHQAEAARSGTLPRNLSASATLAELVVLELYDIDRRAYQAVRHWIDHYRADGRSPGRAIAGAVRKVPRAWRLFQAKKKLLQRRAQGRE